MFNDKRSKKIVFVAHCVLNQNSKIDRCGRYPGAIIEVTQALISSGVGIVQMPCPEMLALGLDRQVERSKPTTIESEDERVAQSMQLKENRSICRQLAADLIRQIQDYQKNGFCVLGILGMNGSPTCGVETRWGNLQEEIGAGVFIQSLRDQSESAQISLPMRGIKAQEPEAALKTLHYLLNL